MSAFDDVLEEQKAESANTDAASLDATAQVTDQADTAPEQQPSSAESQTAEVENVGAEQSAEAQELIDSRLPPDIQGRLKKTAEYQREAKAYEPIKPLVEQHGIQAVRAGTQIASVCLDPTSEPTAMVEAVRSSLPQSQFNKLRDEITWSTAFKYPDVFMQGFFGQDVTVEELKTALADYRQWSGQSQEQPSAPEDELAALPSAVKKKLEDYDRVMSQFPQLQKTVEGYEQQTVNAEISTKADELYDSMWSVVGEKTQSLPLEAKDTDSERVKGIKESLGLLLSQENIENAFLADATNKRNYLAAIEYVKRRDYQTAFQYTDALKVGLERTVLGLLDGPKVKALLSALKSESLAETTPPNPTARKELVAGAPAPFTSANVFDEAAKEGVTNPFDAVEWDMRRTKGQRAGHST